MVTFKGHNLDVPIGDITYHVQTQASELGIVTSMVFFSGAVVYSQKENFHEYIENRTPEQQQANLNPQIELMHRRTLRELPNVDKKLRIALEERVLKVFLGGTFKPE